MLVVHIEFINSAAETYKKISPPKKINITLLFIFVTFLKWFSLRFLKTFYQKINFSCGWLFTDLHNNYASWPLANFPDFPLVKKNHISFIIIYIAIYIVECCKRELISWPTDKCRCLSISRLGRFRAISILRDLHTLKSWSHSHSSFIAKSRYFYTYW